MSSIIDVAKYIIIKKENITMYKLHKLCYYVQAYELAKNDKEMFTEDFRAYDNGPTSDELDNVLRKKYDLTPERFGYGSTNNLTLEQKKTIDIVLEKFGDMYPYQLKDMSMSESPYIQARDKISFNSYDEFPVISKLSMRDFYKKIF